MMNVNPLRFERAKKRLTLQQLAELTGFHPNSISRIENGKTTPRLETLMKLAEALEVDVAIFEPLLTPPAAPAPAVGNNTSSTNLVAKAS